MLVQGLAWGELKQLWQGGILAYITVPWNLADLFTLANFMGWIGSTWKFLWDGQMCKSEKLQVCYGIKKVQMCRSQQLVVYDYHVPQNRGRRRPRVLIFTEQACERLPFLWCKKKSGMVSSLTRFGFKGR